MNPTDADKLDGLDIAGIGIRRESENNTWMVLYPTSVMDTSPLLLTTASDLLAFCRVGVARVDGERFTVEQIEAWMKSEGCVVTATLITDKYRGIAAATARHRKEG